MRLLPRPRHIGLLAGRRVDHIVQPAMPFGRHLRCLCEVLVDDPTARHAKRPYAFSLHIVAVARALAANQPAPQRGVDAVWPGVAPPPAARLAKNAPPRP